jgi:hypothetical protein
MNKISIILFICLLNSSFILMLNSSKEYFLDTCCSLNSNDRIYFSCGLNEKIHLNIIEIYYNSDPYCSEEFYCCKYETTCSRRITKYYNSNCDQKNSCWIDKSCLKIYSPCSNLQGLYGQYITIKYSCLPLIERINSTDQFNYQPVPLFFKLFKSEETIKTNQLIKTKYLLIRNNWKSSPIFLIILICIFIFLILIIYCLADQIGQRICRKHYSKENVKTDLISRQILCR